MNKLKLTVAVPFYNGFNTVENILHELSAPKDAEYEILIIDDYSLNDQWVLLTNLVEKNYHESNIRLIRNEKNIGMDLNFEKCIIQSWGIYTWFLGQDDFIKKDKLLRCISILEEYSPDAAFVNYDILRTWHYNSSYTYGKQMGTTSGVGLTCFYSYSNYEVPSFLPSLILKKEFWPSKEILKDIYNTHFIQLAAFIYILSNNNKWLYIGEPMSVGVIPATGWQRLLDNRIKYYFGFIRCLDSLQRMRLNEINFIVNHQKRKSLFQHILLSIDCRLERKTDYLYLLKTSKEFNKINKLFSNIISIIPIWPLLFLQKLRNYYYTTRKF